MVEDLKELELFFDALKSTSSRIEKEKILITATDFQRKVLEFLFNPYKVTGISTKKLEGKTPIKTGSGVSLLPLIEYLQTHSTGSNADIEYVREVAGETGYKDLVYAIAKKDMTLGVSAVTLNKVFGKGFIPEFGVQLAMKYFSDPDKLLPQGTEFTVTEKLDGVRCILIFEGKTPVFFARSGRVIEGMDDLEWDAQDLDMKYVYDGELLINEEGESNDLYRSTMSIVGSKGEKRDLVFNVFDCIDKEAFMNGRDDMPYAQRRLRLIYSGIQKCSFIKLVPVLYQGTDREEVLTLLKVMKDRHKEGVMINIDNAPYVTQRASGLLKVKTFNECEAVVRSIETGTGRNSNRLGAVIVDIKDDTGKLHSVRVGSGFTDKMRDYYYKRQDLLVGKVVEISYFEATHNREDDSLSLRFPTWLDRVRQDKTEEDMSSL